MGDFNAKSRFSRCFEFVHVAWDAVFIEYFEKVEYLHFAMISDTKVIASRLLSNVLASETMASHMSSKQRGDGSKHRSLQESYCTKNAKGRTKKETNI